MRKGAWHRIKLLMDERFYLKRYLTIYFAQHCQALLSSLGSLCRTPLASVMTLLVIAIALALPAGLYVFIDNIQTVTRDWQTGAQISVFVEDDVSDERASILSEEITTFPGIVEVEFLSRDEALAEFQMLSGFSDALLALPDNPLPPVIIVHPGFTNTALLEELTAELQALSEVSLVQLDVEWVQRLSALLHLGENIVFILMLFLSLAVLLIIGNTIRLAIFNRQNEIAIIKLVGGTDAFIRRPFLYIGVWYGLLAALLAWLMVGSALVALSDSVQVLSQVYQSDYHLLGLSVSRGTDLVLFGMALGWLGAALFVYYHLRRIEPS